MIFSGFLWEVLAPELWWFAHWMPGNLLTKIKFADRPYHIGFLVVSILRLPSEQVDQNHQILMHHHPLMAAQPLITRGLVTTLSSSITIIRVHNHPASWQANVRIWPIYLPQKVRMGMDAMQGR